MNCPNHTDCDMGSYCYRCFRCGEHCRCIDDPQQAMATASPEERERFIREHAS